MSTGAIRLLQHAVIGAAALACVLAAVRPTMPAALDQPNAGAPLASAAQAPDLSSAAGPHPDRPTPGARTAFAPTVERWRPLAVKTAHLVTDAEGATLDPELLLALIAVESSGDERALSEAGAVGLTQVRPGTFADMVERHPRLFPKRDPSDPAENVLAGGLYLVWCARFLGVTPNGPSGWGPALNAYNLGPSAAREVERAGSASAGGLPLETTLHQQRVLAMYGLATTEVR